MTVQSETVAPPPIPDGVPSTEPPADEVVFGPQNKPPTQQDLKNQPPTPNQDQQENVEDVEETLGLAEEKTTDAESVHTPEEIQEMRRNEAQRIVHATIARFGYEALKSKKPMTEAQKAAYGYYVLSNDITKAPIGTFADPIPMTEGDPVYVDWSSGAFVASGADGQAIESIVGKKNINGEIYVQCKIAGEVENVKLSELLNAQIRSEESYLLEAFPANTDQRAVVEAYIANLKQPDQDIQISEMSIREAGIRTALFEAEGLRSIVKSSTKEGSDLQVNLMTMLADQIIADPETAGIILHTLNFAPERISSLSLDIKTNTDRIEMIRGKIAGITDDSEGAQAVRRQFEVEIAQLQSDLGELTQQKSDLLALQKAMKEQGVDGQTQMIQLVAKLYEGNMSADQAQRVNLALQKGNTDEMIKNLLDDLPDDHPEKSKFLKMAEQAARVGIPAIGIILALLILQGAGGAKG